MRGVWAREGTGDSGAGRRRVYRCLIIALIPAAWACSDSVEPLTIRIRTDFVPGQQFSQAEVSVLGSDELIVPAQAGEDWAQVPRLITTVDVEQGSIPVLARLLTDESILMERHARVDVQEPTDVTIVFSRTCLETQRDCTIREPSPEPTPIDVDDASAPPRDAEHLDSGTYDARIPGCFNGRDC